METLELSQEELKYLLAVANIAIQTGKLQVGDMLALVPALAKIQAKIIPAPVAEGVVVEDKKVN